MKKKNEQDLITIDGETYPADVVERHELHNGKQYLLILYGDWDFMKRNSIFVELQRRKVK